MSTTYLQRTYFVSIWEVACRWVGLDPDETDRQQPPAAVRDKLREILIAVNVRNLTLYTAEAEPLDEWRAGKPWRRLAEDPVHTAGRYARDREYPAAFLDQYYLNQIEFRRWCGAFGWPLPPFWFTEADIRGEIPIPEGLEEWTDEEEVLAPPVDKKRTPTQADRDACQRRATALWAQHPRMTIADMMKRPEIQIEANGKLYKENTLRRWLSKVAPAEVKRPGRPRKKK